MADLGQIIDLLDRDGALHLDGQRDFGDWPRVDGDVLPVDFNRLATVGDEGRLDEWFPEVDPAVLDDVLSGKGDLRDSSGAVPAVDVLAWYQPIHFFANDWGIFIKEKALLDLAADLALRMPPGFAHRSAQSQFRFLVRSAFAFLFLHEQYHHKVESLAIRMHIVGQRPIYPAYVSFVRGLVARPGENIEEGLANADAYRRLSTRPYDQWVPSHVRRDVRGWLMDVFRNSPAGYNRATALTRDPSFGQFENLLAARLQEANLTPSRPDPDDFAQADHLSHALFSLKQNIYTVVPKGATPILPTSIFPAVARTDLERFLKRNGWAQVPGAGKGSHTKYRLDGRMIVVPHGKKDVSLTVLSSTARTLGINVQDLKQAVG